MWMAHLAEMNVGIITVLWSITPLMVSIGEYFIYKHALKFNYLIGMLLMVLSAVVLSFNTLLNNSKNNGTGQKGEHVAALSSYVPVLFALITPLCFTSRVLLIRKMTNKQFGVCFNTTTLTMTVFLIDNVLFLVVAIFYWKYYVPIDWYLILMGTIGVFFDSAALNVAYLALGRGPGGPIVALFSTSTIGITAIESLRYMKAPSLIELIGGCIGMIGALELVIPDKIEKIFCFCKAIKSKK